MGVGIRVTCDQPGCGRHIDMDVEAEQGAPLLVTRLPTRVWIAEMGVWLGNGWGARFEGKPARWRLFCRDHAGAVGRAR